MLYLDMETFSRRAIKNGPRNYAKGAEILCLAWAIDDGPVHMWAPALYKLWLPPKALVDALNSPMRVVAHEHLFERAILDEVGVFYGLPTVPAGRWVDTMHQARMCNLPASLDGASKALNLEQQKCGSGKRLIRKFCIPVIPSKAHPRDRWAPFEAPEEFDALCDYCVQDVETMRALHRALPRMPDVELPVEAVDSEINKRGIPVDVPTARKALKMLRNFEARMVKRFTDITGLAPSQTGSVTAWAKKRCHIPNLQAATIDAFLVGGGLEGDVYEALSIRRQLAKASTKKISTLLASETDGRVCDTLIYHRASTGRWGGGGIQPHNFIRSTLKHPGIPFGLIETGSLEWLESCYPDVMQAVADSLRLFIRAPEGYAMFTGDLSSIEARVVCWLAGQQDILELYLRDADLYCVMAERIYGVPAAEIARLAAEGDPRGKQMRGLGKAVVLGCGYQMGKTKFRETCEGPQHRMKVTQKLADKAVDTYRETYRQVSSSWSEIQKLSMEVVRTGEPQVFRNKVTLHMMNRPRFKALVVDLPSGRSLYYPFPELGVNSKPNMSGPVLTFMGLNDKYQWVRMDTYGGKLVENIVQAISRDIIAYQVLRIEDCGYEVFLTVHDSIHALRPLGEGHIDEFLGLMREGPAWSKGVPLNSEGHQGQFFGKS